MNGLFNEMTYFNGQHETVPDVLKHYDELGGPTTYGHYAAGWAVAGDTPFEWTKQVASSYGGTRNGMVIHWPKGITAKGELRSQWHHVIDIAPTILEAAGVPEPKSVNGTVQTPIEGVSMVLHLRRLQGAEPAHDPILRDPRQPRHLPRRLAGRHRPPAPWEFKPRTTLENDTWELYDTQTDFSLAHDLAVQNPEKLKELQELFLTEAVKYHVLPLDDRTLERLNPALVGRPDLMAGRTSLTLSEAMTGMSENVFINVKNRSHTITAEVEIPKGGANGVILAQAGRFGGWSLYVKDGRPTYTYNWLGLHRYTVAATQAVPPGKATIRFEFAYDGGGVGKGATGSLFVNEKKVATGRIEQTQCCTFSGDEGADVGADEGTPVTEAYKVPFKFTGKIVKVTIDLKDMQTADHDEAQQTHRVAALKKALSD